MWLGKTKYGAVKNLQVVNEGDLVQEGKDLFYAILEVKVYFSKDDLLMEKDLQAANKKMEEEKAPSQDVIAKCVDVISKIDAVLPKVKSDVVE